MLIQKKALRSAHLGRFRPLLFSVVSELIIYLMTRIVFYNDRLMVWPNPKGSEELRTRKRRSESRKPYKKEF